MISKKQLIILFALFSLFILGCAQKADTTQQMPSDKPIDETSTTDDVIKPDTTTPNVSSDEAQVNDKVEDFDTTKAKTDENGCYDSEGGIFYEKKGYIIDVKDQRFEDECLSTLSLSDVYCGPIGYKAISTYSCDFGCKDGQCMPGDESLLNCIDSDYDDYYNKGTVTYMNETKTDYCKNGNTLIEHKCSLVELPIESEKYCSDGCEDGACILKEKEEDTSCTDTDFGPESEYVKGNVTDPKGTIEDECLNSNTVKEYRCNSIGYRAYTNIACPNGCVDGACVKS